MALAHEDSKFERLTVTLIPRGGISAFTRIPSTFSLAERSYSWNHYEKMNYMIIPQKISVHEIKVDIYIDMGRKGALKPVEIQKQVQSLVKAKLLGEWSGLRLDAISRPIAALPPARILTRGTIEEILGVKLVG